MATIPATIKFSTSEIIKDVSVVEQKKAATFVGDFCLRDKQGQYVTQTVAVFYQPIPPDPSFTNYFALFVKNDTIYITDGSSAVDKPISAIISASGEIVYSRHRHDFRWCKDYSGAIDGGRDYTKLTPGTGGIFPTLVTLNVDGAQFTITPATSIE